MKLTGRPINLKCLEISDGFKREYKNMRKRTVLNSYSPKNSCKDCIKTLKGITTTIIAPDLLSLVIFHLLDCGYLLDNSHEDCYVNLKKNKLK